ncbi:hypothetical protein [Candidatus Deianiraea vastatrix]|uniref:Uncharacterized protein n=1 Tax=Candidatus Deianiraea vastatrix TaxID=2163644 RepID=A0A5B8XDW6_9RICK|nr:hypothetical protein [Candidatus Deianiraea vastatrix]QED23196.1 hypothetical protein Deia_00393 [Candidatus Deianiraea vastatrix]
MKSVVKKSSPKDKSKDDRFISDISLSCAELFKIVFSSNGKDFIAKKRFLKKNIAILKKSSCKI